MNLKVLLTGDIFLALRARSGSLIQRTYATTSKWEKDEILDITSVDQYPKFVQELAVDAEIEIEAKRNKSRLNNAHRNILHGQRPYETPDHAYYHYGLQYKRTLLGRYGIEGSGVPPGVAWPTKEVIADMKEYEKVAYPHGIPERWAMIATANAANEAKIKAREDDIARKLAKTGEWEKQLHAKIAKREAEMRASKERKDRLVEEVRRHFGFKVDPRDEKFKEMLEQKEKEQMKRRKEERKKERSERITARLLAGSDAASVEKQLDKSKPTDLS